MALTQPPSIPHTPGVYLFKDAQGTPLYIGKARDLTKRLSSYFQKDLTQGPKTRAMVEAATQVEWIQTETELEALLLESTLIKQWKPKYNILHKDDKAYKYIRITVKEAYPRVLTSRQKLSDGSRYFGPFPAGHTVNHLLRDVRRMFPYCNEGGPQNKACFYAHIGQCPGVCKGEITSEEYQVTIRRLVRFLAGGKEVVVRALTRDMKHAARLHQYEKAGALRDEIERITYITQRFRDADAFLDNPHLRQDIRETEIQELCTRLTEHGYILTPTDSFRLEGYDMSNIQGEHAVGSMVVSIHGEAQPRLYRRFKIKHTERHADVDFMEEVLTRRFARFMRTNPDVILERPAREPRQRREGSDRISNTRVSGENHPEVLNGPSSKVTKEDESFSTLPDLILVDGGIPQVRAAEKALSQLGIAIPLIGLAKQREHIVLTTGEVLSLPKTSPALHLLQRLRDEAHRFANRYNRTLRKKALTG